MWYGCLSVTGITLQPELNLSLSSSRRSAGPQGLVRADVHQEFCSLWMSGWCVFLFWLDISVGTATFPSIAYSIRTQTTLLFSAYSWVILSLPLVPASRDRDWPSWSRLLASCSLHAFSRGSVMSPNTLGSKLESSVLQMVLSLIRKSLMSAKSHVGARVCSSVMSVLLPCWF